MTLEGRIGGRLALVAPRRQPLRRVASANLKCISSDRASHLSPSMYAHRPEEGRRAAIHASSQLKLLHSQIYFTCQASLSQKKNINTTNVANIKLSRSKKRIKIKYK